jgi:uncharacterized protein
MKLLASLFLFASAAFGTAAPLKVLIIDGQNNHDWQKTTPELESILEEGGLCAVDVSTSPAKGGDWSTWRPKFAEYQVVISNYNGDLWPDEVRDAFEQFVKNGGGFVAVHAADNSFPEWKIYNDMIGLGGWGGRTEKSGPYLRLREGKWVTDITAGRGGSHGKQHEFLMSTRAPEHPIMAGLPTKWMHRQDELYDRLRGPAKNVTVLASALSDKETGGSGEEEPLLMAIPFGSGRVFHTALGHGMEALKCAGFAVTLRRGVEWAATGKVTQAIPKDFPDDKSVKPRP